MTRNRRSVFRVLAAFILRHPLPNQVCVSQVRVREPILIQMVSEVETRSDVSFEEGASPVQPGITIALSGMR